VAHNHELSGAVAPKAFPAAKAPPLAVPPTAILGMRTQSDDTVDGCPAPRDAVRPRFLYVVARTHQGLFESIRRRFMDDPTVYVLLDRRKQDRRTRSSPLYVSDRRRLADRRGPTDYWENTAYHPAVLISLPMGEPGVRGIASLTFTTASEQDKESTMEPVPVNEARLLSWVQQGQQILDQFLPVLLDERNALRTRLDDAVRRCNGLEAENTAMRAEVARATASYRQLAEGHAELVGSVGQFLTQMTSVLEPMRIISEKIAQAGPHANPEPVISITEHAETSAP
jgi:hypothetical protein